VPGKLKADALLSIEFVQFGLKTHSNAGSATWTTFKVAAGELTDNNAPHIDTRNFFMPFLFVEVRTKTLLTGNTGSDEVESAPAFRKENWGKALPAVKVSYLALIPYENSRAEAFAALQFGSSRAEIGDVKTCASQQSEYSVSRKEWRHFG
jgi:hypothetical protein